MKNSIQSVLLLIAVLMSTTGAVEVKYAQVNETVTLTPPVRNNLNKYSYWFFGSTNGLQLAWSNTLGGKGFAPEALWKDRLFLSGDSLIITNIQQENFGHFFFTHTFRGPSIFEYKLLKLTVTVKPPSPLLLPGDNLYLSCNAETLPGHKPPVIHWLNPQQVKVRNNRGSLTVKATSQDNGKWTCVVTHDEKEKKATVSVTVVDLSPAPLLPQYTSKSWLLTVPCSFPAHISWQHITAKDIQEVLWDFVPKPGSSPQRLFNLSLENPLTWKPDQNRGLRPVKDPQKGDLSLNRNRGREDGRGDYECALKFKNGVTLKRTVHVEVLQIIPSPGTELISGQQLNLTCSIGHPLPSDLEVKWVPPEQSPLSPSDRHHAHLIIPEVGTGGGGKWRCELWRNDTRLTSADITLKIEPKLSVWMLVVICSVTSIVILLLILVFILCRRRKRKTRHHRRQLCQCKTPKPKGFYRT